MAWSEPSVATAICTVHRGHLDLQGRGRRRPPRDATLAETARLLRESEDPGAFYVPMLPPATPFLALAALVPESEAATGHGKERLCRDARTAVSLLGAVCGVALGTAPLHQGLAELWSLDAPRAELVRKALALLAGHELNASTFATRVAASTGTSVTACLLVGLSALSGPRHGGAPAAARRRIDEATGTSPHEPLRT